MRLRTFHAASMAEAMAEIRKALGPDAIIVSSRRAARGMVEVVAAIEAAPAPENPPPVPDRRDAIDRRPDPFAGRLLADDPIEALLAARLAQINEPARTPPAEARARDAFSRQIRRALDFHRTPKRQSDRLVKAAAAFDGASPSDALAHALSAMMRFAPLADQPQRSIMLVGTPGVGKTVATAKIAARAAAAGTPLRVVTTDTLKAGATAQLEAYLRAMNQPLGLAANPAELAKSEHGGPRSRRAVIDTAGVNPFDESDMVQLTRLLAAADVEPVVVLAAGIDAHDAMDTARAFSRLGARRFIVTRLDATRRLGSLIAAAEAGGLALAEVSASPFVGQGLRPLDAAELARLIMQDYDHIEADPTYEEAAQ
ncbi:hypothetical protein [Zavarzinia compransoris]|uniref:SRP54-type proteins GTP-binding domain-containing protein n=1 Tax=Zavarzinia compransoris TaxID=1264899 RepID=A0A317E578_9PROT|nr:hypothetical protein [Zavarzinia compransoris]PWR21821.1 hypothetical protein DKG75_07480 [Zavarzinia compransoris]TDP45379.1 flagellar biosynthesis protein FlhF [Zavarzinia compransoris]